MGRTVKERHVVVVGAGLAGLEAARQLVHAGARVSLLERESEIGGRAITANVGGIRMDQGAQFMSAFYHETLRLVEELGLSQELVHRSQTAAVVRDGRACGIWPPQALYGDHAISLVTKARLLNIAPGLIMHWRKLDIADLGRAVGLGDRSAAEYLRSKVGEEALEFFFAPLVRGLLYWDIGGTSKEVLLAVLKAFLTDGKSYRLSGGLSSLTEAMVDGITEVSCDTSIDTVKRITGGGVEVHGRRAGEMFSVSSDAVVVAVTADAANTMCRECVPGVEEFLSRVSYSRTTVVTFEVGDAADYPKGVILFSTQEIEDLASVNPFPTVTVSGRRMVRVFLSDRGAVKYDGLDDEELSEKILSRLREVLGRSGWITGAELVHVKRWPLALPKYGAGYVDRVVAFRRSVDDLREVAFAGDYLDGPYMDGAIRSGMKAAAAVLSGFAEAEGS